MPFNRLTYRANWWARQARARLVLAREAHAEAKRLDAAGEPGAEFERQMTSRHVSAARIHMHTSLVFRNARREQKARRQ